MMRHPIHWGSAVLLGFVLANPFQGQAAEKSLDFARDIRPILSENCFACHGPDKKKRRGDLRLDVKEALFEDRGGVVAIVPGKASASEVYRRISTHEAIDLMPPPDSGKKLTAQQKDLIKQWIDNGAPWASHWAFVPPKRPPVPAVKNTAWVRNEIDAFILARLEKEGLSPSPEADRLTLFRRLHLDLIGLPPTIAELDAFESDRSDAAYDRQVTRLLDSPHYGERWARFWLDGARYADSDGYEKDKPRFVWAYRDWVINALNRDLPYDQFIIEQIAGDLLPGATQDQIVATGFLRNSMINEEGGVDPEQFRMEAMFDRMDAIGKSVLGLTIQCAQCHSHKYDPLTQQEYYQLFAFLNNSYEANVTVYPPKQQQQRANLLRQIHELEQGLRHREPRWKERLEEWETTIQEEQPTWTILRPEEKALPDGGQKYRILKDGSLIAEGYAPTKLTFTITIDTPVEELTAFRLDLLNHPNLPRGGPGRSIFGTGALTEFRVQVAPRDGSSKPVWVKFKEARADCNPAHHLLPPTYRNKGKENRVIGPIQYAIDGNDKTAWSNEIDPGHRNEPHCAVFVPDRPIHHAGGMRITFYLDQKHGGWNSDDNQNYNLGRFRFAVTSSPIPTRDPLPPRVEEAMRIPKERRSPAQWRTLFSQFRTTVPEWKEINERIEQLWAQHPVGTTQLVMKEGKGLRTTHLLKRGNFLDPGDEVQPGVPAFLNPLPAGTKPDRLAFARWLVDRQSPTTARAIVNRVWQSYFGVGLVRTTEDLGTQSEPPSHPELLDWLAVEFMERGWSLKALHRLIVSSATYRQSSHVTPGLYARDPYNRLLARGPRFRVDAEMVRDIALTASGLLHRKIGGPSVYPPAPAFLFVPPASYGPKVWNEEKGPNRYRRALYTFRFRSVPYPMLDAFDAPPGNASCVKRSRSNTPLQALITLNEPMFLECAQALGRVLVAQQGSDEEKLRQATRRCLGRGPRSDEARVLLGLLGKTRQRIDRGELDAKALAGADSTVLPAIPAGTPVQEVAAWTVVSRVLLNLDTTITKE